MSENSPTIATVRNVVDLRAQVSAWRADGDTIALVPTMGSLHDGHLSLVRQVAAMANRVVVSIFVNPTQFAANEDLDTYPRDESGDLAKLATVPAHLVYAPTTAAMYPPGFESRIRVGPTASGLCSVTRPHFFEGVATVVGKLLIQAWPDVAIFGEKDYQQLLVIRRMARDLDLPVEIVGAPILREPDGLAMSSRNAYLNAKERRTAPQLNAAIVRVAGALKAGEVAENAATAEVAQLTKSGFRVDYLEVRDAVSLAPIARLDEAGPSGARVLVAAHLGKTRLIDNVAV